MSRLWWMMLLPAVLAVPYAAAGDAPVITVPGVPDPHGSPDLCTECHGPAAEATPLDGEDAATPAFSAPGPANCVRCHPETNFHVVGMVPETVTVPDQMLLGDTGRMDCVTCHDEPACDGLPRDGRGEYHFRGGPYRSSLDLCFRCHERQTFSQTDPHRDLRDASGTRNDSVCIFCHQGVPVREGEEPGEDFLRIDAVELCKGCHAREIHIGIPSHLVIAEEPMVERIESFNKRHHDAMPLGSRGEITCTTCHDPHPGLDEPPVKFREQRLRARRRTNRGYRDEVHLPRVADQLAALDPDGRGALTLADGDGEKAGLLRVPADDGTMCLVCHDVGRKH